MISEDVGSVWHHVEQNSSGEIKIRIWLCTEFCIFQEYEKKQKKAVAEIMVPWL